MTFIDKLKSLDDLIFEEYQGYVSLTLNSNFSIKFPSTFNHVNCFCISSNFIKNSIFTCTELDDLFGVKILFRSLIEHYLRFKYIWFNWIKSKNDDLATVYTQFTKAKEILDLIKSVVSENKLDNPNFSIKNWDEVLSEFPDLKNYSKKEIENETLKYSYKNIIKLLKEIDEGENSKTTFFNSLISEYSKLSSFVHGGAGAFQEMNKFDSKESREIEYNRICRLAYQMAGSTKLFTLILLLQFDKEPFEKSYLKIDELIKLGNE